MKKSALEIYCEGVLSDFPSLKPIIDNIVLLAKNEARELVYARQLVQALATQHYPENTQFEPLPDLMGLLTQIDNMTAGMTRRDKPLTPEPSHFDNAEYRRAGDKTLKDFGYAPGNYALRCMDAKHETVPFADDRNFADKRAWRCLKCAQRLLDAYNASASTPVDPKL